VYRIYIWKNEAAQNRIEDTEDQSKVSSQETAPAQPNLDGSATLSNAKTKPGAPESDKFQGSSNQMKLSMEWAEGGDPTEGRGVALRPRTWEELQQEKNQFEERVLKGTHAERIRVETPSIVRKLSADSQAPSKETSAGVAVARSSEGADTDTSEGSSGSSGEDPETAPGYVAFMSSPEGFEQGVEQVMEEIAQEYIQSFPKAPRVTVSLIVGGGVRQQGTFLNNGAGGVINPE
jgi:hypothetical protein